MNPGKITNVMWVLLLVSVFAVRVQGQSEAGSCAGVQGPVEVQHAGAWRNASIGAAVFVGDHVRTGAHSRTTIVFRDDSVLDLAPNTELTLEIQEFDESARHYRSLVQLAVGKVRVWASAYYSEARARYELETPTAVAAVRGTEFIASYDSATEMSEFVDLEGQVEVTAKLAVMGTSVTVGPHAYSRVPKGKFPTAPQRIDDARLPHYLDGVDLVGTGRRDGLNVLHPAVVGRLLAPQDVPSAGVAPTVDHQAATELTVGAPRGSAADNLSPDVYTNTQPLLDYRRPPTSTGSVRVRF